MKLLLSFGFLLSFYGIAQASSVEECKTLCHNRGNTYVSGTWSPGPCSCALQGQGCKTMIVTLTDSKKGILEQVTEDMSAARHKKDKNCE